MQGGDNKLSKTIIFFVSTLPFIMGIASISFVPFLQGVSEFCYFGFFLIFLVILFLFRINRRIKIAILIAIFLFLGLWRYAVSFKNIEVNNLSYYNKQTVEIKGVIKSDIIQKNKNQKFELDIEQIKISNVWQDTKAKVLVYADIYPQFNYGDELFLFCDLKTPESFEGFAYDRYLALHNIYSICYYPDIKKAAENQGNYFFAFSYNLKNKIRSIIDRGLSEPESGLARAIILGDSKMINDDLRAGFSRSGISHIVAISGLHIAIIVGMIAFFLFKIGLSRNQVFYLTIIILVLFIVFVGMPVSAVRAGIMVAIAMYALKIGRTSKPERLVIFTVCVLMFINPKLFRDDIGFQLSFTAVLGIIYIFPIIKAWLEKIKITNKYKIRDILGVTMAAQIATMPIAVYYFEVLPILGIIVNLFVLWVLPFLIGSIVVAIIIAFILKFFIVYVFFVPMIILDYIIIISSLVNKIPFAYIEIKISIAIVLLYYFCLIMLIFLENLKNKNNL